MIFYYVVQKGRVMVIYFVFWERDKELSQGKGRPSQRHEFFTRFTVICRNISDATSCLFYHFNKEFPNSKFDIDDGKVTFSRVKIDSRNFHADYLYLAGMREPLYLTDIKSNYVRLKHIF